MIYTRLEGLEIPKKLVRIIMTCAQVTTSRIFGEKIRQFETNKDVKQEDRMCPLTLNCFGRVNSDSREFFS